MTSGLVRTVLEASDAMRHLHLFSANGATASILDSDAEAFQLALGLDGTFVIASLDGRF